MSIKVSVIIPVYNVQKYLDQCVESIINQSYKNMEIILVDDGATDNSPEMIDRWSEKDTRIITIHKTNGGLSSARNAGLEIITGDAVFFLDSDDIVLPNTIEVMVNELEDNNSDVVSVSFMSFANEAEINDSCINDPKFLRGNSELFFLQKITNHSCGKLFRRRIIGETRFPEGRSFEDIATTHYFYRDAKIVSYTEAQFYLYRVHESSITYKIDEEKLNDIKYAYKRVKQTYHVDDMYGFYMLTILYVLYSRLMRSNADKKYLLMEKRAINKEFENIYKKISIWKYKDKSPMFWKLIMYHLHMTDLTIKVVDMIRKVKKH